MKPIGEKLDIIIENLSNLNINFAVLNKSPQKHENLRNKPHDVSANDESMIVDSNTSQVSIEEFMSDIPAPEEHPNENSLNMQVPTNQLLQLTHQQ